MGKGNFMETNLILEGFKFMGLGMGTVFLFLIIMIGCMNLMSIIIHKFFPEPEVKAATAGAPKDNKKVIAAITAAIKHHREG
jgi:oxaloacetate decarboxylase gamma subunit